jgi:hypothetical protein
MLLDLTMKNFTIHLVIVATSKVVERLPKFHHPSGRWVKEPTDFHLWLTCCNPPLRADLHTVVHGDQA